MSPIETLQKIAATRGHVVEIETRSPDVPAPTDANPWRVTVWRNPTAGRVYRGRSENAAISAALNDYRKTRSAGNREDV